jgi:hypothetical protein
MSTTTRLVRVNSRFRASGTSSVFTYKFDTKLVDDIESIELISCQIPRLFSNIYPNINVFEVRVSGGQILGLVTIPPGNYTATELATAISTNTVSTFGFEVTYNETTKRFIFDSLNAYTLTGRLLPYLGIPNNSLNPFALEPGLTSAPYTCNLSGPNQVYLQSSFIASSSGCVDSPEQRSPYIPLIIPVDCSSIPYGFVINFERKAPGSSMIVYENLLSLRGIDISLLDEFGNELDLGETVSSDFVFRITVRTSA